MLGSLLGIMLAIAIVHVNFLAKSLMPWIIASQTIPILALAHELLDGGPGVSDAREIAPNVEDAFVAMVHEDERSGAAS